jgi:hypothetical protein
MNRMIDKDPTSYEALTYVWVIALSTWGGVASYIRRFNNGGRKFSLPEFVGEMCISGFVGVMTFFFCEAAELPQIVAAALIGISGHMGSRAIFLFEKTLENVMHKRFNNDNAD